MTAGARPDGARPPPAAPCASLDESPIRHGDAIHPFRPARLAPDQLPPDYMSLAALMLGPLAALLEAPTLAWLSVFCFLSSLANMNMYTRDTKQIVCALACVILGLIVSNGYFLHTSVFCAED